MPGTNEKRRGTWLKTAAPRCRPWIFPDYVPISLGLPTRASEWVSHVPLPQRNLAVLALAMNLAQHLGARRILLALNRDDQKHGPRSRPEFLHAFTNLVETLVPCLQVVAPPHALDKSEVIRAAASSGIDWTRIWSCLLDHPRHCGRCPQCEARRAAFAAAGIADPTNYLRAS